MVGDDDEGQAARRADPRRVADEVAAIGHIGLVTVLVGDDPASDVYIRLKHKAANEAGFDAIDLRLPADTPEDELLARLAELNASRPRSTRSSSSSRCRTTSTRTG